MIRPFAPLTVPQAREVEAEQRDAGAAWGKDLELVERSPGRGEGCGDLGVRFDKLNELWMGGRTLSLRSLSVRSLSVSKGRKVAVDESGRSPLPGAQVLTHSSLYEREGGTGNERAGSRSSRSPYRTTDRRAPLK